MDASFEQLATELLRQHQVLGDKIQNALQCQTEQVEAALIEVLRFMRLAAASDVVLTPSHRVDLAWHEFILFTRLYQRFCDQQFGKMIHHTPGGTGEENRKQFAKTLDAYREQYGEPNSYFWPTSRPIEDACGACESA